MTFVAIFIVLIPNPFYIIIPNFRSDTCFKYMMHNNDGKKLQKWQLTANEFVYIIVNFFEIFYLYYKWMKLNNIVKN